jgi:hypothetical protein
MREKRIESLPGRLRANGEFKRQLRRGFSRQFTNDKGPMTKD